MILHAVLMAFFLCFSAFFSGMEAAIFSLSRFRVKTLIYEERRGAKTLERLKKNSGKTLAAILLANLLVNIGAASMGALLLIQLIENYQMNTTLFFILESVIMTSLLLIIGEITPKTVALKNAESLSLNYGRVIQTLSTVFKPVSYLMELIARKVTVYKSKNDGDIISDKEIKLMLHEAKQYNVLDEGEEEIGYRILKFGKIRVCEIMTPRHKVIGVDAEASINNAKKIIRDEKHSRICVFDHRGDVVGILYAKDVFINNVSLSSSTIMSIKSLIREPYIVHETKHAEKLLAEFRKNAIHIAVVVDEFGSFAGIITLEDILESMFGEIIDEYDQYGELTDVPYKRIDDRNFLFNGDISIGELARILEIEPFADEGERLSGFIFTYCGKIPKEKEVIKIADLNITIEEMKDRVIEKVRVTKKSVQK